jgi:hypothetical protein
MAVLPVWGRTQRLRRCFSQESFSRQSPFLGIDSQQGLSGRHCTTDAFSIVLFRQDRIHQIHLHRIRVRQIRIDQSRFSGTIEAEPNRPGRSKQSRSKQSRSKLSRSVQNQLTRYACGTREVPRQRPCARGGDFPFFVSTRPFFQAPGQRVSSMSVLLGIYTSLLRVRMDGPIVTTGKRAPPAGHRARPEFPEPAVEGRKCLQFDLRGGKLCAQKRLV